MTATDSQRRTSEDSAGRRPTTALAFQAGLLGGRAIDQELTFPPAQGHRYLLEDDAAGDDLRVFTAWPA